MATGSKGEALKSTFDNLTRAAISRFDALDCAPEDRAEGFAHLASEASARAASLRKAPRTAQEHGMTRSRTAEEIALDRPGGVPLKADKGEHTLTK